MKKRGQAAMEFLMTYGWAILIVLVVIAALYYLGLFDSKTQANLNFNIPGTLTTKGIVIDQSGATIELELSSGASATVTNIQLDGSDCPGFTSTTLVPGINKVKCVKSLSQGQDVKVDVIATYTSATGGVSHTTTASGSGTVEKISYETMLKDTGIVALYRCEGNTQDSSSNQIHGTAMGGLTYITGKVSQACNLIRSSSQYISIPYNSKLNLLAENGFTFSAWIKKGDTDPNSIIMIPGNYYFKVPDTVGTDKILFQIYSGGWQTRYSNLAPLPDTNWHHLAITFKRPNLIFYKDGQQWGTATFDYSPPGYTSGNMYVGSSGSSFSQIAIDDVAIFNRVLTSVEITALASP